MDNPYVVAVIIDLLIIFIFAGVLAYKMEKAKK